MAAPDPNAQYHLPVDASKKGLGGVLFQLGEVEPGTEATNTGKERTMERIIMFISFRLAEVESRHSNSERQALAVILYLAEVRWMRIGSPSTVFVYTDHEALKTLLTGPDNNAHGQIAKWQERLGEYNLRLLHRPARTHFMAIADGLSRLPTHLLSSHFAEDVEGCRPLVGHLVQVSGKVTDVRVNGEMAMRLRLDYRFWRRGRDHGRLNWDLVEENVNARRATGLSGMVILQRESKEDGRMEDS